MERGTESARVAGGTRKNGMCECDRNISCTFINCHNETNYYE